MGASKIYTVRVTNEFRATTSAATRPIEGLIVPADGRGFVGSLSDEQLKAAIADPYLSVTNNGEPVTDEKKAPEASQTKTAAEPAVTSADAPKAS